MEARSVIARLEGWANWFIPETLRVDPDSFYRARLLVLFELASIPTAPLFALVLHQAPLPLILTPLLGAVIGIISLFVLRKTGAYIVAANLFIFSLALSTTIGVLISGGVHSPVTLVLIMHPVIDIYLAGVFSGVIWTAYSIAFVSTLYVLEQNGKSFPVDPAVQHVIATFPIMLLIMIFMALVLSILYERIRVQLYRQLRGQQQVLVNSSKMAALGEMASGVAHEINNPLAIIGGNVDRLKRDAADGTLELGQLLPVLGKMSDTVSRMAKIIIGLRSFSRDAQSDPFESVPAFQIVENTLDLCSEKFKEGGLTLIVPPPTGNPSLSCRKTQLSQALLNLLNNAFEATAGQPKKWVKIETVEDGAEIAFAVSNSGPPIPLEIRDKIFQPFFTTKDVGKGTGLGLSVSKGIAESHHGALLFDPLGDQTRFVMRIPKESGPRASGASATPEKRYSAHQTY